jgi:hypothetical protein
MWSFEIVSGFFSVDVDAIVNSVLLQQLLTYKRSWTSELEVDELIELSVWQALNLLNGEGELSELARSIRVGVSQLLARDVALNHESDVKCIYTSQLHVSRKTNRN